MVSIADPARSTRRFAVAAIVVLATMPAAVALKFSAHGEVLRLTAGPHLFLDDHLIEYCENIRREVVRPTRHSANPLITGRADRNFQPYVTVVRDPASGHFRVWYNIQSAESRRRSHLGHMESSDGVNWARPHKKIVTPFTLTYGASILDRGPDYPEPRKRFKYAYHHSNELRIAVSPDGLAWMRLADVAIPGTGDINNLYWDPIRSRYGVNLKDTLDRRDSLGNRWRVNAHSTSENLHNWTEPRLTVVPDLHDEGETQFYCMGAVVARGNLLIGMVRVLRDDLPAEPDGDVAGIGYTTLAWSRDGENWTRDREPFLDRAEQTGAWDRAMAWIDCQLPVDDEVYLYYGGYRRGHKIERNTERQIGLAIMLRDRYVSRAAGTEPGLLRTPPVALDAGILTLNADASDGSILVQIVDLQGEALPGFSFADCRPVTEDALGASVKWKRPLSDIQARPVQLEFMLHHARLFAIGLDDSR